MALELPGGYDILIRVSKGYAAVTAPIAVISTSKMVHEVIEFSKEIDSHPGLSIKQQYDPKTFLVHVRDGSPDGVVANAIATYFEERGMTVRRVYENRIVHEFPEA